MKSQYSIVDFIYSSYFVKVSMLSTQASISNDLAVNIRSLVTEIETRPSSKLRAELLVSLKKYYGQDGSFSSIEASIGEPSNYLNLIQLSTAASNTVAWVYDL